MISNATANAIGSKVTPGGSRSNPELITNGDFSAGPDGWLVAAEVAFKGGNVLVGPPARPPYAAIAQNILEDLASYNVVIDVVSVETGGVFQVLDGKQNKVAALSAAGQKSFTFTNTVGATFSIVSSRGTIVISNVSVKKS